MTQRPTMRELVDRYKSDPGSLTPAQLEAVERRIRRAAKAEAKKRQATGDYGEMRRSAAERNRRVSEEGRDIGPPPAVKDPERRKRTSDSFRAFCEAYHADVFYLPWSTDHLHVIKRIEEAVLKGGLFALAMPRGSGKTSLCEAACEWAILTGARRFVALIGCEATSGEEMLDSIKSSFECNDLLLEDFPETVYPVRCLDGIANRCKGQHVGGHRTHIEWTQMRIVLPSLPAEVLEGLGVRGRNGCEAILKATGLLARVRGMKFKRPDGQSARPDIVVVDDPQTDATARSATQCRDRKKTLTGAVLKLAGPDQAICGFMPCTVICPGDVADQVLDRDLHPEWRGERMKMVYAFPTREDLWEEYAALYRDGKEAGDPRKPNAFYRKNRKAMDRGAKVAWPQQVEPDEVSGIQHAMNWKILDEESFFAEGQNEPIPPESDELEKLEPDQVLAKVNGRPRGEVPLACTELTAFVDVQERLLYWKVCAWEPDFTGYVVDYGTWPEQKRVQFTARKAPRTLKMAKPGAGLEGAIYAGLEALTGELLGKEWPREDGAAMRIGLCYVDSNWGQMTEVVYQACRQSPHAALLMPSRGQGITASMKPLSDYDRRKGDRIGFHWWVPRMKGRRSLRHVEIDTNFWKSFIHTRLAVAMGDRECLSLFGKKDRAYTHRMLAEHVTSEYRVRTAGRGRTVDEWKQPANKPDNHWFDCLVGCACAASMRGVELGAARGPANAARREGPKVSWNERQRRKRLERPRS